MENVYTESINLLINKANKSQIYFDLSDIGGESPLYQLHQAFTEGLKEINELMKHSHDYDGNGFCYRCGCDGNA